MVQLTLNKELNGIEISFDSKPDSDTLTALKKAGYRWHRVKKVWYAKQTADRLTLAERLANLDTMPEIKTNETKINLDNLGQNAPHLHGAELAAAIREDLKRRGVKGVTVRSRKVTHDTGITVTIKATAADIVSVEEYQKRYPFESFSCDAMNYHGVFCGSKWVYAAEWEAMTEEERRTAYRNHTMYYLTKSPDFNNYHQERKDYPAMTTDFYNKVVAVFKIANQWNYNHSDSMSDYFDVGYYLDIDIKIPEGFTPAEKMTDEEIKAYEAEKAAEEAARQAEIEKYRQEQEEAKKAREAYEAQRKIDREQIYKNIEVIDLPEAEQMYITNLIGGHGKESTLEELREAEKDNDRRNDAIITRKVVFSDYETFNLFTKYLLDDWDFLQGMGGTASEDVRLEEIKNLFALNEDQRADIKWYMCNCIAFYVGGSLELISNPEGYSYSRYTYELTNATKILHADIETEKQRAESESKTPFYFPAPIDEQVKNLHEGQQITIYQTDGWMLNNIYAGAGEILSINPGTYAQYKGIYIAFTNGKQTFIRDNKHCLIYEGIKPKLPDTLTTKRIDAHMVMLLDSDELFPRVIDYYNKQGIKPIIDTIQR